MLVELHGDMKVVRKSSDEHSTVLFSKGGLKERVQSLEEAHRRCPLAQGQDPRHAVNNRANLLALGALLVALFALLKDIVF
jgi:hypothetical protein